MDKRQQYLWLLATGRKEIHLNRDTGEYCVTQLQGTDFSCLDGGEPIIGQHRSYEMALAQYENRLRDRIATLRKDVVIILTNKLLRIPRQCCYLQEIFPNAS